MSGVPNGDPRGRRVNNSYQNEESDIFQSFFDYFRIFFKCMPDLIPSILCLITVIGLSTILQTESDLKMVKDVYSKLLDMSNSSDDKLRVVESLILRMGIDCGVEDIEMRNVKDNRLLLEEMIKKRISEYDCVNNGMINWASSSLGGGIIKMKGAEPNFDPSSFLGIPCSILSSDSSVQKLSSDPLVQKKSSDPKDCWTFKGEGKVLLKLAAPIYITHFTIEHFPRDMIPNKDLSSAPKLIVVKGYRHKNDISPHIFGALEFKLSDEPTQTFPVPTPSRSQFEVVEFQFRTNHGNQNVTCVYKIQVHGRLTMDPEPLMKKS